MSDWDIIPKQFLDEVRKNLNSRSSFFTSGNYIPPPITPQQRARREWCEKREREAYVLAPWLKDELEAAESYY